MEQPSMPHRVRYPREARSARKKNSEFVLAQQATTHRSGVQDVQAGLRKQVIRVVNRPARFPPAGAWPVEVRADMAAALLDFDTTRQLCKAIAAGTAPRPGAVRGSGKVAEVVWSTEAIRQFVACRHGVAYN
jgi:hypothetical protein